MTSKRKRILFLSILATLLVAAAGLGFLVQKMVEVEPTQPTPTAEPTPNPTAIAPPREDGEGYDLSNLSTTAQAEAGYASMLVNFVDGEDLGSLDAAFLPLAANTIDRYVENSVANPYFVSDFWKTRDNYRVDSLQTYITPLMSELEAEEFLAPARSSDEETIRASYSDLLHIFEPETRALVLCEETWDPDACFYQPFEYTDASFSAVDGEEGQIKATVIVKTYPVYQKPEAFEGESVYAERTYNFEFLLQLTERETTGGAEETPILEIADVTGSLVIGQVSDYIVTTSE